MPAEGEKVMGVEGIGGEGQLSAASTRAWSVWEAERDAHRMYLAE